MADTIVNTPPTTPPLKTGWKTSEFWLSFVLAPLVGALIASQLFPEGSVAGKILTLAATMLGSLGYSISRGMVKQAFHTAAKLLLIGAFASTLSACATCREDAHRNDLSCWAVNKVIDCTTDSVVPEVLPLLSALVQAVTAPDGTVNWAAVEDVVVKMGVRDGGCLLAALQDKLAGVVTSASTSTQRRAAEDAEKDIATTLGAHWPGYTFTFRGSR